MRGVGWARRGIIPALAGNTALSWMPCAPTRDHPRSRVEYKQLHATETGRDGSSPLSRGIPPQITHFGRIERIIPALAGNTRRRSPDRCRRRDHPRSRGEYVDRWNDRVKVYGSSPLSRGIPPGPLTCTATPRIIPALAGNTIRSQLKLMADWDHPRSRGEYATSK